jgi:hypothetical protein
MIANPIPWPDGARCAVAMTWDMDADSAFNWYNQKTADNLVAAQSWVRYDPLIAIPRLVEHFARLCQVYVLGTRKGCILARYCRGIQTKIPA